MFLDITTNPEMIENHTTPLDIAYAAINQQEG